MTKIQPWSQTFTGLKFWLTAPQPDTICIEDIAHSLSMICRYNGHTKTHYSVAQHSVIVSELLPDNLALSGLLHDAAEAYIGDQTKPYKDLVETRFSLSIEYGITLAIYEKFRAWPVHDPKIKEADEIVLRAEALQVLAHPPIEDWHIDLPKKEILITEWPWELAEKLFLKRFDELTTN